jgi:YebC/PmpR family DNA-binding regulatory protein
LAGHSKWANIRHRKGAKDLARGAILGKASLGIMAASKACGGDLANLRLQSAIAHAKSVQLPKDRIDDAIARGTAKGSDTTDLKNVRYDAMLTMGGTKVACIVTALTDNRNRTASSVRHLVSKEGCGELMATDSLSYVFDHVGQIVVDPVEDEDALLECALEAGALNVEPDDAPTSSSDRDSETSSTGATFLVTTADTDLFQVVTALQEAKYHVSQFEHRYVLQDQEHGGVELTPEGEDQLIAFLDKMDENEDVTNVYHNAI